MIAEKRVLALADLMRMLIELEAELSPMRNGVEPLRHPKDLRITSNPTEEQIRDAERVFQKIRELSRFVVVNEMILGLEVIKTWHFYFGAFQLMQIQVKYGREDDIAIGNALQKLMLDFIDEIAGAIKRSAPDANLNFVPATEWQGLKTKGINVGKQRIDAAKDELRGRTGAR